MEYLQVLLLFVTFLSIESQNPAVLHAQNQLRNKEQVYDTNHIKEHLEGVVDMEQEEITNEQAQFHYFKIHDYDHDNRLDGIELTSALTHYQKEENSEGKSLSDEDIKSLVDTILEEDDKNNDGYIDYSEFVLSQRDE